jgi:hypothetical protein
MQSSKNIIYRYRTRLLFRVEGLNPQILEKVLLTLGKDFIGKEFFAECFFVTRKRKALGNKKLQPPPPQNNIFFKLGGTTP